MSQESNTESNSGDKPKKRLSLKKKAGGSSSPAANTPPDTHSPKKSEAKPKPGEGTSAKPRMSLKNKGTEGVSGEPARPEAEPDSEVSATSPETSPPPPNDPVDLPPPSRKIPIELAPPPEADLPRPKKDSAPMPPGEASESAPPQLSGAKPPPGIKIHRDDEEAEAPPRGGAQPIKTRVTVPPPVLPASDLMAETIEDDIQPKGGTGKTLKGLVIAALILAFLVGGVAFLVWGVLGVLGDSGEEAVPLQTVKQQSADKPKKTSDNITPAEAPKKGTLANVKELTETVSAKASTEEITQSAEPAQKAPSAVAKQAPAPKPTPPPVAETAVVPPSTPRSESAVRSEDIQQWVEDFRPNGFGRGIMIANDQKYRIGEMVNEELGIRWVGMDQQLGLLYFEDKGGAIYEKDY